MQKHKNRCQRFVLTRVESMMQDQGPWIQCHRAGERASKQNQNLWMYKWIKGAAHVTSRTTQTSRGPNKLKVRTPLALCRDHLLVTGVGWVECVISLNIGFRCFTGRDIYWSWLENSCRTVWHDTLTDSRCHVLGTKERFRQKTDTDSKWSSQDLGAADVFWEEPTLTNQPIGVFVPF